MKQRNCYVLVAKDVPVRVFMSTKAAADEAGFGVQALRSAFKEGYFYKRKGITIWKTSLVRMKGRGRR